MLSFTAQVNNFQGRQAIFLPKEIQLSVTEVVIRTHGEEIILSPKLPTWEHYLATARPAPTEFMTGVTDEPPQERSF
jgi:virulence-associated protein VagC